MLGVHADRLDVEHFATPELNAALHNPLPSAVKLSVPLGELPLTVAVNVTLEPTSGSSA